MIPIPYADLLTNNQRISHYRENSEYGALKIFPGPCSSIPTWISICKIYSWVVFITKLSDDLSVSIDFLVNP